MSLGMIDIENDVFNHVYNRLIAIYPELEVDTEFVDVPAKLPAVTISEANNYVLDRMQTVNIENAVRVMYEVNVFSNKVNGKKKEAKEIANVVDSAFSEKGFARMMRSVVPNFRDATIHRIIMRYEGVVGPAREEGKFLVYQQNY